jgi:hypothetical protein
MMGNNMPAIEKLHDLTDEQRKRLREGCGDDVLRVWQSEHWQIAMRMVDHLGLSSDNVPDFAQALLLAQAEYMGEGYVGFDEFSLQNADRPSDVWQ